MSYLLKELADASEVKPKNREELLELLPEKDYSNGKTVQAFKDETDIRRLLSRAQREGTLSHLQKYEGVYGDFADFDFLDTQLKLIQANEIFSELPSEIRNEFGQSPAAFFDYVNDPANASRLPELLPQLAAPGRQNIDVSGRTPPPVAASAAASAPQASVPNPPAVEPAPPQSEPATQAQ